MLKMAVLKASAASSLQNRPEEIGMPRDLNNIPEHLREHTLLKRNELLDLVPYTMAHIYRLEAKGDFPRRIKVGERRVAWRLSDILRWLGERPKADQQPQE